MKEYLKIDSKGLSKRGFGRSAVVSFNPQGYFLERSTNWAEKTSTSVANRISFTSKNISIRFKYSFCGFRRKSEALATCVSGWFCWGHVSVGHGFMVSLKTRQLLPEAMKQ